VNYAKYEQAHDSGRIFCTNNSSLQDILNEAMALQERFGHRNTIDSSGRIELRRFLQLLEKLIDLRHSSEVKNQLHSSGPSDIKTFNDLLNYCERMSSVI
jgi:hypothetical protein